MCKLLVRARKSAHARAALSEILQFMTDSGAPEVDPGVPTGTRVHVKASSGGGAGFVADDLGPIPTGAVVQLDQRTSIKPRRYAVTLDSGSLLFLDAADFEIDRDE